MGPVVVVGVDIGQQRDPTALCVAEEERRQVGGRDETHFLVRHLERLPPGTRYPDAAERVAKVVRAARVRAKRIRIYVDATGVGQPIVGLIRSRVSGAGIIAVYFNHGDRRIAESDGVRLGKGYLVARLQLLLQCRRLHLPQTPEAEALSQDLQGYEVRVTEDANDRSGAFRVGAHDDLVTALGLAVQVETRWVRLTFGPRPWQKWGSQWNL